MIKLFVTGLSLIFIVSCHHPENLTELEEGMILYDISYSSEQIDGFRLTLLPKKMILKFNRHSSAGIIEGMFGFFTLTNIYNSKTGKTATLLKISDSKVYYESGNNETPCCFLGMDHISITKTEETKYIAGLKSYKALGTLAGQDTTHFDIWFTRDIKIKNPNAGNPYRVLDGVLLQFQLRINDIAMELRAEEVIPSEIYREEFEIPHDYLRITQEKMQRYLSKLLE